MAARSLILSGLVTACICVSYVAFADAERSSDLWTMTAESSCAVSLAKVPSFSLSAISARISPKPSCVVADAIRFR